MIKVAFFADILSKDFDGASRTMYQIISRIDEDQFAYAFITGHNDMPEGNKLDISSTFSLNFPLQRRYKMGLPQLAPKQINKKLAEFKPDVIHIATPSPLGIWAAKYAKKHNIPTISIFHTFFSSYLQYYFKRVPLAGRLLKNYADNLQAQFYNKIDKIYVPSSIMQEELIDIGVKKDKITIWARGINMELFNPARKSDSYLKKIGAKDAPTILFVSRLVWEKNLDALTKVYAKMQENKSPPNFVIVGDGHAKKSIQKLMPQAIFTGNMDHDKLATLYASSDVLFFPSVTETFGNVVLEGLASGLPVVVSDKGGTRDMIKDGKNGFICRTDETDDYIQKIMQIVTDNKLKSAMSKEAQTIALTYNWDDLIKTYFDDIVKLSAKSF